MRYLVFGALGIILASVSAHAAAYTYECSSIDDHAPYSIDRFELKLQTNGKARFTLLGDSRKHVASYQLDEDYTPRGDRMKKFDRYDYVKRIAGDDFGDGPIPTWMVEKALASGGYALRRGGVGGFVKTSGPGYSWASFICELRD